MAQWTADEVIVLLAFYFRYPRASQTDSHPDCIRIAKALGRTPGAIDSQLRNIDFDLVRRTADRHVSRLVAQVLDQHKDNLPGLYRDANRILSKKRWKFPNF